MQRQDLASQEWRHPTRLSALRPRHLLLAGATAIVTVLAAIVSAEPASRSPGPASYLLAAALASMVLLSPARPLTALIVSAIALVLYHVADYPAIGVAWPLTAVIYLAGAAGKGVPAGLILAVGLAGSMLWRSLVELEPLSMVLVDGIVREASLVLIALLLGEAMHRRAAWRREVELRLEEERLQRDRSMRHELARQRMALAREVHDTVAHTLAVVGVQADVAAATIEADPRRASEAIEVVRRTNRRALSELRATVALLRTEREGAGEEEARQPVPSLAGLPALAARVEALGLRVEVEGAEALGQLPSSLEATAFRVVQEALTNVLKHAQATVARVRLWSDGDQLHVEVVDDGPLRSDAAADSGHGLRGMRERAAALGGELLAGPMPTGGFRVRLDAPLRGPV